MLPLVRYSSVKRLYKQSKPMIIFSYFSTATGSNHDSSPIQPSPPPIQVLLTQSAGRGVFATRNIGAGELIHTAKPIVSHPYLTSINKRFYEVEKKSDWSAFIGHCRTWGLKYPLLVKRLACMVISGVASADILDILQPAILSPQKISQMEEEHGLLRSALENAGMTGEQLTFLTNQWYNGVMARIRINAFRIELAGDSYEDLLASAAASVEAEAAAGNAVYMLPSFYNHDCDPNTHIMWIQNVDTRLKALRDIEAGEELRICYIDASMDHDARQHLLSIGFGFDCQCPRCLSND